MYILHIDIGRKMIYNVRCNYTKSGKYVYVQQRLTKLKLEEFIFMKYETAFKRLKEKFSNVDSTKLNDMAIQFTLSDEDCGGTFYAEVKNSVLAVEPYDYKDNDAVVDVTRSALSKILDGKLSIEKAIEIGELTVKGDLEKIYSVVTAIVIPEKKAPAKQETPAKKAVKKAAPAVKEEVKTVPAKKAAKAPAVKKTAAKKTTAGKAPAAKKVTK